MVCRSRRRLRPDSHNPRRHPLSAQRGSLAGRTLHHGGLLVHCLNIVRKSSGRDCSIAHEYFFRHPPCGPARVHRRRASWRLCRDVAHELDAWTPRGTGTGANGGDITMTATIYHNPDCGTSRNTLAMIRQSGIEPTVIEYLKTPPSREKLKQLISAMGISARAVARKRHALHGTRARRSKMVRRKSHRPHA